MKARLLKILKILAFPAFYVFCLLVFGYVKFPYGRLKDRIVAEFDKHAKPGEHLEIGTLNPYWLTGVEVSNVKLHLPPEAPPPPAFPGGADFGMPQPQPGKEQVIVIDEAHARVRFLPLLLGRVRVDFWASAFGGEISGTAPVGSTKGEVEVEVSHVDLARIEPLSQAIGGVPLKGSATGKLSLDASDGKLSKASGSLDMTLSDVVVSDGKTKIQGMIELPPAKLGELVLQAEAKEGNLKVTKLSTNGTDLDLAGEGKVSLKDPWSDGVADLFLRFKFTDAYRVKSPLTKTLLGEPGSPVPGSIEMLVPKMKAAKRPDGFFGFHIAGPLKRLRFDPYTAESGAAGASRTTAPPPRRPLPLAGRPEGAPLGVHRPGALGGLPPPVPPAAKEREEPAATAEPMPAPLMPIRPRGPIGPRAPAAPPEAPAPEAPAQP